jgi:hypothetical protein
MSPGHECMELGMTTHISTGLPYDTGLNQFYLIGAGFFMKIACFILRLNTLTRHLKRKARDTLLSGLFLRWVFPIIRISRGEFSFRRETDWTCPVLTGIPKNNETHDVVFE